ncbi:pentatricopeptide repeat-containing protein At5g14080 isoform X2 [Phoenix dactylifera]|uniref:Pentatricopeptide repeat-containing protein At5g14080 isoform X2 n=1 Tax=Phoenix dactylifera TaxID=42345 RepID=A0A8B8J089_PHODC|nr:pentatricopeptide repeat-containing protein At5g14080 isoform X2 [Phoenix dactylifera]XP_026657151.1 pentatricopeptide repeat-containing protein At5g14080 isoform X2 [Phoenix dactylifera]XP_038989335.1 pentatricopeptide repeat-containing protein At5g14080 isoform X2 [Phoenix dactylifera]
MAPPPPAVATAARRLSRALLSAAKPSRSWTPALEQTLHRFLLSPPHRPAAFPLTPSLVAAAIDPHLLRHHPLAAGLFHWASQQPGFSHSPESFHSLLKSLALSHQPHSLQSLLKLARARKVPLFPSSYHLAISSLLFCGKTLEAAELIEQATADAGEDLPSAIYNSLLAAVASDGFLHLARKVSDRMLRRGIRFNDVGFGVYVGKVCRVEEFDRTLSLVEQIKQRFCEINGSVIAALIVDGLCRVGRIEDAWHALEELRSRGCKPDFIAYRIVSEGFRVVGRVEEAMKILKQKRKLGVAPRANDYREFILSLISERRIQEAKDLGEAIVGGDFPIEDDVLNALVESVSAIDPDSAVSFCMYMIGKERFPSLTMLCNLSRNLCKNGKSDEMWDVFKVLSEKGYFSGVGQYNVMVSFLCKAGRLREAYDMFKEMKKKGFGPDISSYNMVMEACCREDLLRPAKKLWDEMFANGCSANLQTYNILIRKLPEAGQIDEAQHLFHHMLEKGVPPDNVTYTSLIKALCLEKKLEEAIEICNRSMKQDVVLAGSTLNMLILTLCQEGPNGDLTSWNHVVPFNNLLLGPIEELDFFY